MSVFTATATFNMGIPYIYIIPDNIVYIFMYLRMVRCLPQNFVKKNSKETSLTTKKKRNEIEI